MPQRIRRPSAWLYASIFTIAFALAFAPGAGKAASSDADLVRAQNGFGLHLYRLLAEGAPKDNVVISPTSVHVALGMLYAGAAGETLDALAGAMQVSGIAREVVLGAHRDLLDGLNREEAAPGVQLNAANALWHRDDFVPRAPYTELVRSFYRARISGLDFDDPQSVEVINRWVEEETQGLIPRLLEGLDDDLVMLLVNAVYFKGDWTVPFSAALTRDMPFHPEDGERYPVPMMYRDGRFYHYAGTGFQAVRLPYGPNETWAMYVFVPEEGADLEAFRRALTLETWDEWMAGFRPKQGTVYLPRLDLGYKVTLNDALRALGMGIAFDGGRANFRPIQPSGTPGRLAISDVIHQTALKVDEEGTEAAAATSIGVRVTSMPLYEFELKADRPFFVAIRDEATGLLLFVGSVTDPGAE